MLIQLNTGKLKNTAKELFHAKADKEKSPKNNKHKINRKKISKNKKPIINLAPSFFVDLDILLDITFIASDNSLSSLSLSCCKEIPNITQSPTLLRSQLTQHLLL